MRCDSSEECVGGAESAARAAPVGGPPTLVAAAPPTSAIAARAATAHQLTQRSATRLVEEVQVLCVDGDRYAVADLQLDVRWEGCDEIGARADDARLVLVLELFLGRARLRLDLPCADLEVGHRLAAERLDELDVRGDLRQRVEALD